MPRRYGDSWPNGSLNFEVTRASRPDLQATRQRESMHGQRAQRADVPRTGTCRAFGHRGSLTPTQASLAFAGLVRGHAAATTSIRAADSDARVGAAINLIVFDPSRRWALLDWIAARPKPTKASTGPSTTRSSRSHQLPPRRLPRNRRGYRDWPARAEFFGINYYRRNLVRFTNAPGVEDDSAAIPGSPE